MRLRPLPIILALVLALGLLAGCGGGDDKGSEADSSTDATQLLNDTFSGSKDIKSGKLDIKAEASSGGQTFSAALGGPFQSKGSGKVPELDLDATLEGGGQSLKVGLTTTSDQAFVNYGGTDYQLPPAIYQGLQAQYEEQAKKSGSNQQSLASLGIDPSKWMTNAKNAGEEKVGDTDTIKITGDVDIPKLLDDLNGALAKIRTLGGAQAQNLPDQLSESDKQQVTKAVKDLNVEVYTGADDKIMRRLVIALKLQPPGQSDTADVKFDMQFLDLNEDQEVEAPDNAKPFSELAQKLQGLGLGGGLGALGGSSGGSSGSGSSGPSNENLEKYSQCIQDANGAPDKIRKCGDLLTP